MTASAVLIIFLMMDAESTRNMYSNLAAKNKYDCLKLHHVGYLIKYRVIHKSLRHFRTLRYSSRDGHAEGEHVNRGRDTQSFCPTLQVLDMCVAMRVAGT
jgi:hypothetical protein